MWPDCINTLSPFDFEIKDELPKFLSKVREESDNPNTDGWQPPIGLISLLGKCSTAAYVDCPNMPEHHPENARWSSDPAYYFDSVGKYYWLDFNIVCLKGESLPLRMVFNEGDADCNDGLWGAVWDRDTSELVANIASTGDCEATVEAVSEQHIQRCESKDIWIPVEFDRDDGYDPLPCESIVHAQNLNLEKFISLAIRMCCVYRNKWSYERQGYELEEVRQD